MDAEQVQTICLIILALDKVADAIKESFKEKQEHFDL